MKRIISILLALTLVLSLGACAKKEDTKPADKPADTKTEAPKTDAPATDTEASFEGETLVIWSFTNELEPAIAAFKEKYKCEVELNIIPTADYPATIKPALASGVGAPDVYTAEAAFVEEFVNNGFFADLGALGASGWEADYTPFVYATGTDYDGVLRAVSWQMTPGGLFYRRTIAKEVFGTDEPDEISALFSSKDKLFEAADKLSAAGYKVLPDEGAFRHFANATQEPWVRNDVLNFSQDRIDQLEYAKKLRDGGYTALAAEWSPAWFSAMQGPVTVGEGGPETTVFAFTLPTWGLHYVLKTSIPEGADANPTAGDWGLAQGPNPYSWGGTWLGVYNGSTKQELAFNFVKMMAHDEEFLLPWLLETGDVTSILSIQKQYVDGFTEPFLGGQNHVAAFVEAAGAIKGDKLTKYDQDFDIFFNAAQVSYVDGLMTLDEAVQSFKDSVAAAYPEVVIE